MFVAQQRQLLLLWLVIPLPQIDPILPFFSISLFFSITERSKFALLTLVALALEQRFLGTWKKRKRRASLSFDGLGFPDRFTRELIAFTRETLFRVVPLRFVFSRKEKKPAIFLHLRKLHTEATFFFLHLSGGRVNNSNPSPHPFGFTSAAAFSPYLFLPSFSFATTGNTVRQNIEERGKRPRRDSCLPLSYGIHTIFYLNTYFSSTNGELGVFLVVFF